MSVPEDWHSFTFPGHRGRPAVCWECRHLRMTKSGFLNGSAGKESTCQCRRLGFYPWVGKVPWRRKWQHSAVFLPEKSHR